MVLDHFSLTLCCCFCNITLPQKLQLWCTSSGHACGLLRAAAGAV